MRRSPQECDRPELPSIRPSWAVRCGGGNQRMWKRFSGMEGRGAEEEALAGREGSSPSSHDRVPGTDKVQRMTTFVSSSVEKQEEIRRHGPTEDCESWLFLQTAAAVTETQLHHQGKEVREGWRGREEARAEKHRRQEVHSWAGHTYQPQERSYDQITQTPKQREEKQVLWDLISPCICGRNHTFLVHSRS